MSEFALKDPNDQSIAERQKLDDTLVMSSLGERNRPDLPEEEATRVELDFIGLFNKYKAAQDERGAERLGGSLLATCYSDFSEISARLDRTLIVPEGRRQMAEHLYPEAGSVYREVQDKGMSYHDEIITITVAGRSGDGSAWSRSFGVDSRHRQNPSSAKGMVAMSPSMMMTEGTILALDDIYWGVWSNLRLLSIPQRLSHVGRLDIVATVQIGYRARHSPYFVVTAR